MEVCKITIITPVYNRSHLIGRVYQSLLKQKCHNFIWMIIDDGSIDGVDKLVFKWQQTESPFPIVFYSKENGGKSTAYNLALEHIETPYWTCVDSDDWVTDTTVERYYYWIDRTSSLPVAGFVGLDANLQGNILGGYFPYEGIAHLIEIKTKIRHKGDMNMVYRTDISKKYAPMPTVDNEKDFEPYYFLLKIDEEAPLYLVNEVFVIADYQKDGLSQHIWRTYIRSPISMGMLRLEFLRRKELPLAFAYRQCIHYVSSWLIAAGISQKKGILPFPIQRPLMIAAWIPGFMLYLVCLGKGKKYFVDSNSA